MRSMISGVTCTPGTSLCKNSALRNETNGQMPAMMGMRQCSMRFRKSHPHHRRHLAVGFISQCRDDGDAAVFDAFQEVAQLLGVEHRLRDRVFRAGFDLPFES